ncbi:MAG: hypothetical protein ACRC2V_25690 [Xenococcaceae cyanobacterium]
MSVLICPGIHSPQLTESFLQAIQTPSTRLVFPSYQYPAYSTVDIFNFLLKNEPNPATAPPLLFICFSAGVVGGIGAAIAWQMQGGKVNVFIAIDGWGVPLFADFSIHRFSHDYFTHWSSALLGAGEDSFYADPAVEHLEMWRSPQTIMGWWQTKTGLKERCSAADALKKFLKN